ncbi:Peptidoglycan/xylan/chitin deacetylase, PgdA/CDA1 family [Geodermatophilus pulveris]|uniref:Peptidoglycan/xylan/chitin deacetylase, PgdA/CDA1 family n=1 Tax=Geodermatophilus pulveris TaxID=1564159 RepID=A0A239DTA9_9ACTN|nr:polysaccharide deacetylase family protein [Geodermatophilus pulveris]SNS34804.1 Peptidoglycan/xylan/chitin deacetylase, PgdA/CDA1 family [Geodermatophilus pulveris]
MERRRFLVLLAAGLAGAAVGRGTAGLVDPARAPVGTAAAAEPGPAPRPAVPPAPAGVVDRLPGENSSLALTIDDGTSSAVVGSLCRFAEDTGVRLTFFPNGRYSSWEDNADRLQPLVDSGQVAMGNHTWSHLDLTTLSDGEVADEVGRNRDWIERTFGVTTPFLRPPFGAHDERVDRISAELGHPTIVMWNGTLEDNRLLTPDELVAAARRWFTPQAVVVGHANRPTVTTVYDRLVELIAERGLRTVTLADAWGPGLAGVRTASGTASAG